MPDPFYIRFNIEVPIEEARRRFVNRIANRVRKLLWMVSIAGSLDATMYEVESKLGEPHSKFLDYNEVDQHLIGERLFVVRWAELVMENFFRCLQALEGLYIGLETVGVGGHDPAQKQLNDAIVETLAESEVDVGVSWQDGYFTRKGAELLDEKLVNEPLRWLADAKYQNVLVPFQKGLSHLLEGTMDPQRYGDAVTDMYEALEAIAKIVTAKPTKDLSGLREELIGKLRLPETHKVMLKQYIEYACDFRHALETGQKRTWPSEHEAENFVYLTGLFIRLAIQAEKE
jgi:hypothetical protein